MEIIKIADYSKVLQNLKEVDINTLFAQSILKEKVNGKVYVDDPNSPSAYYIVHPYGMSLLFGNTGNDNFNKDLSAKFLNLNKERDKFEWMQVYPDNWYSKIESLLREKLIKKDPDMPYEKSYTEEDDRNVLEYERINFIFNRKRYNNLNKNQLIDNFSLVKTTGKMFNEIKGSVIPSNFWNNSRDFINNSIGFSILNDKGDPVSTAFAAFIIDDKLELGIETVKDYYGKGFAPIVCCALIDYCIQNCYDPIWACSSGNIGSIKLAKKIGFDELKRIPYYRLSK